MSAAVSVAVGAGRAGVGLLKRAHRKGREKGCHVYIAADVLREVGIDPDATPPLYLIYPGRKGRGKGTVLVSLYAVAS